jgi:CRP/FNR family transcriptional regulator
MTTGSPVLPEPETASDTATIHPFKVSCAHCRVKPLCLSQALADQELDEFDKVIGHKELLQRNQHLLREGDKFESLFVVRMGAIKAYKTACKGEEHVTGFYFPGQILGMDGIFGGEYSSSAVALETSAVCEIPYTDLEAISASTPCMQRSLLALLSQRIVEDQQLITLLSKYSAEQRVAAFLLRLIDSNMRLKLSATHLRLPMRRVDIANHLGVTVETISRILSRLERLKILQIDHREVTILNAAALKDISAPEEAENFTSQIRGL